MRQLPHRAPRHRPPLPAPPRRPSANPLIDDKPAFLDRVRRILAPCGVFWVVTKIAGRRTTTNPTLQKRGISPLEAELLTTGWSCVRTADLNVLRCYALRPCPP
ncbi:hypothetical protein [Streptomyces sp. NPDC003943]